MACAQEGIKKQRTEEVQVAILAGGLALRMGNSTEEQPKSMVRVLGKPFVEYQLEFLRWGGVRDMVLCIGHLGEQIESHFGTGERFGANIKYSHEERLLDTAGALKNAEAPLYDMFFTLYGDSSHPYRTRNHGVFLDLVLG